MVSTVGLIYCFSALVSCMFMVVPFLGSKDVAVPITFMIIDVIVIIVAVVLLSFGLRYGTWGLGLGFPKWCSRRA